ncbi:MAG: TIGR03435 family protein [Acidobacteria bacterium]|nr:TIGR03435 family protein [Acidobacteriota bacterium]
MITANLSPLANHLWQSTLFAAAAWSLTLIFRKNRAAIRYGIWLVASAKFLIPFSLLVSIGSQFERTPVSGPLPISHVVEQMSQPFVLPAEAVPTVAASSGFVPAVLFGVWFCGFAVSVAIWLRFRRRFRAAVRASTPLHLDLPIQVMTSRGRLEPGVFGVWKPILLLPEGILSRLTSGQLQAILAHELCHVRRRDNLTAAMHMVVESIFWFHPLVWWIGRRLVEERERACDEEVVRIGNEPRVYAEGILKVCKYYLQSPLACAAGVTGANLTKRIEDIVDNRIASRLTATRKILLAAAGIAAVAAPVLVGLWHVPSAGAQSEGKLVFEVASIKRMNPDALGVGPRPLAPGVTPGGGIRSFVPILNVICWAYRIDAAQLSGGPSWVRSERYAIVAKPEKFEAPDDPSARLSQRERDEQTRERMKALLADRFRMAVRTETKEAEVYVLSVARGGHKLRPDPEGRGGVRRGAGVIEGFGAPVSFLPVSLTMELGRPVLDETAIDGRFKFKLEFRPEGVDVRRALAAAGEAVADDDPRPSIFTAIKNQLGLELQSRKGPVRSVVIERIERPTEN